MKGVVLFSRSGGLAEKSLRLMLCDRSSYGGKLDMAMKTVCENIVVAVPLLLRLLAGGWSSGSFLHSTRRCSA